MDTSIVSYSADDSQVNIENRTFGKWLVLGTDALCTDTRYVCQCDCGEIKSIRRYDLLFGKSTKCKKCHNKENTVRMEKDLSGLFFDRLFVLGRLKKRTDRNVKYVCVCVCGKIKNVVDCDLNSGKTTSCGCKKVELGNYRSGERCPAWRGGITTENNAVRSSQAYREWRVRVFVRDNHTCQKCNQRGKKLKAHHIEPFSKNRERRMDMDNGITLCDDCHKEFHSAYGSNRFSKTQFYEWLGVESTGMDK